MINFQEQLEFFKLIGGGLKERVTCFVIGGSAMMFYGAKDETKDVDMVFLEEDCLNMMKRALSKMGFDEKQSVVKIFRRYEKARNTPVMMVRGEERFDLFLREIITMKMSETIIDRARETHEFGNLLIKVVAPEDIFLLKSATEREKDKADALSLIQKFKLDWKVIIGESLHQTKLGQHLFPVFLFGFLYELKEDLKAEIPGYALREIRNISEDLLEERIGGRKKAKLVVGGKFKQRKKRKRVRKVNK